MDFSMKQIGVIHTPYKDTNGVPIQSIRSETPGSVELFSEYRDGLDGIEEFSHIYLLYIFHKADTDIKLKVQPFLDDQTHGVFATRFPVRPNTLGFSVVRVIGRRGSTLDFIGADMLDATPLLDIKPYLPAFDIFNTEKEGWYQTRKYQ